MQPVAGLSSSGEPAQTATGTSPPIGETRKWKMKPPTSRDRLDEKLEQLMEEQKAARERRETQFNEMIDMFKKQHEE